MSRSILIRIIGGFGLAVVIIAVFWHQSDTTRGQMPQTPSTLPKLQGDEAKQYLTDNGMSNSLAEAVQKARYSVVRVERSLFRARGEVFEAQNPQQGFAAYFSDHVELISREADNAWNFRLELTSVGDEPESAPTIAETGRWSTEATRTSRSHDIESQTPNRRSKIIEYFENRPEGLEHGFVVSEKIERRSLRLVLKMSGDLQPRISDDGQSLSLAHESRGTVLRYDALKCWDVNGTELRSRMELDGDELSIVVDDESAVYPVTVDPNFTQVKKLLASDGQIGDNFGLSVAVNGDTTAVSAIADADGQGSVYVFRRNSGGANNWSEVRKITAADPVEGSFFGQSVEIEGDTLVVGAPGADAGEGAIYIFSRNAGGPGNWGQIAKRTATGTASSSLGTSVGISGDTIIAGAPEPSFKSPQPGAAYIFQRNAGGTDNWGEVRKIDSLVTGVSFSGAAVAIDGDTAVLGGGADSTALIVGRDAGGADNWGLIRTLIPADDMTETPFASAVAIDGDTVVANAPLMPIGTNDGQGAAYVFQRNAGGADNWGQIKRLVAQNGQTGDNFSRSVAVDGNRIVVGAFADDVGTSTNQGSAYVFESNAGGAGNWGEVSQMIATGGVAQDRFGTSIALDANTTVVGAPGLNFGGNTDRGSAFVFIRDTTTATTSWSQDAKPVPVNCTAEEIFGQSVAVSGDIAVVGSPGADYLSNAKQGVAYIFERNLGGVNAWGLRKIITSSDGAPFDNFGTAVAIDVDTIVVGVRNADNGSLLNQGALYVFERDSGGPNSWGQTRKLVAADGQAGDYLGSAVAISGDTVVGGARHDTNGPILKQGSAYVFERDLGGSDNWGESKKLSAADGSAFDLFGSSVAIDGDTVVVGAYGHDTGGMPDRGAAYVFERDLGGAANWGQVRKLVAPDGAMNDDFGLSVAVDGNLIAAGSPYDDVGTDHYQGSVHLFDRNLGGPGNWGLVKKLVLDAGTVATFLGFSVDIDGDAVTAGAPGDTILGNQAQGSAYVFRQNIGGANNWGRQQRVSSVDATDHDFLGNSVAISGNTVITGAFRSNSLGIPNLGAAYVFTDNALNWDQNAKLLPMIPANCGTDDNYGFAVAIDGDTAVIGATADDVGINQNQGSAYVLDRNQGGPGNWGLVRVLTASDGASNEFFGRSVAIDGDTVVVGASNQTVGGNTGQGAAYVFKRHEGGQDNFGEVKKLVANDGAEQEFFGWSVAIDGNTIVSSGYYGGGVRPGSAYLFRRNTGGLDNWGQIKKLTASDGTIGDAFGWSVGIDNDTVVVGSKSAKIGKNAAQGAVYVFDRNAGGADNWGEHLKLTAADGAQGDGFGGAIAVENGRLIVGANLDDFGFTPDQGSAYVFERNAGGANSWGQVKKLFDPTGEAFDYFGVAVGISNDVIVVGVIGDDIGVDIDQGSARIFSQNAGGSDNWGLVKVLTPLDGGNGDSFGGSVAISGDNLLIGAFTASVLRPSRNSGNLSRLGGNQQGAAYVFRNDEFVPTAANVSISGRVATSGGRGIGNATLVLTSVDGTRRTAISSSFGNFRFDDVEVGQIYTLQVVSKRFEFAESSRVFSLQDEMTGLDFIAQSP